MHHLSTMFLLWLDTFQIFSCFCCCLIASGVGKVEHFLTLWCNKHFRKKMFQTNPASRIPHPASGIPQICRLSPQVPHLGVASCFLSGAKVTGAHFTQQAAFKRWRLHLSLVNRRSFDAEAFQVNFRQTCSFTRLRWSDLASWTCQVAIVHLTIPQLVLRFVLDNVLVDFRHVQLTSLLSGYSCQGICHIGCFGPRILFCRFSTSQMFFHLQVKTEAFAPEDTVLILRVWLSMSDYLREVDLHQGLLCCNSIDHHLTRTYWIQQVVVKYSPLTELGFGKRPEFKTALLWVIKPRWGLCQSLMVMFIPHEPGHTCKQGLSQGFSLIPSVTSWSIWYMMWIVGTKHAGPTHGFCQSLLHSTEESESKIRFPFVDFCIFAGMWHKITTSFVFSFCSQKALVIFWPAYLMAWARWRPRWLPPHGSLSRDSQWTTSWGRPKKPPNNRIWAALLLFFLEEI